MTKPTCKKPYRAEVTWVDSTFRGRWWERESATEFNCMTIVTIGWLIDKSPEKVVLAFSHSENDDTVGDTMAIPTGCIKRIRRLK